VICDGDICLERDAKKRLHDIADARLEMDETLEAPASTAPAAPAASRARWPLVAAAAVAAAALGIFFGRGLLAPRPAASPRLTRLKIPAAAFVTFSQVAISPDGRRIAFVKYTETIASPLFVRDFDEFDSKPLAGTEGARNPFFSPDGRSIAFFSSRGLQRVSTEGGTPQALCDNTVMIAPFDTSRLATTAAPALFPEQATTGFSGVAAVAISREGTLVYSAGAGLHSNTVVWVDRKGVTKPVFEEPASWAQPRLSPDGRRLAVRKILTPNCDVWVCDLERSTLTRLTAEGDNHDPLWAPDGKRITFDRAAGR
jgi:WD40-like Beta Propeller Repeat